MRNEPTLEGTVDVRIYLEPLIRQKRLIVAITLAVFLIAVVYTFTQPAVYTSRTTVLVQPTGINLLEIGALGTTKLLNLDTEVQLVQSGEVAALAADSLGAGADPQQLLKHASASAVGTSQTMEISFTDPSPAAAQKGATAFANAYLDYRETQAKQLVQRQTDHINADIAAAQAQVEKDNATIASRTATQAAIQVAKVDRASVQDQITNLKAQQTATALLNTNPGQVVVAAQAPTHPSSPNHPMDAGLGLFLGLVLGLGVAFVRGRTDQGMHEATDLEAAIGVPALASIARIPGPQSGIAGLVAAHESVPSSADAYRALRTTLMSAMGAESWTLMVVSSAPGEGKTTVASNLAVVLAKMGKRVVLVSADMRRPRLHEMFGVSNNRGLSDVLQGKRSLEDCLSLTELPNLIVCPAGPAPANPVELLGSRAMGTFIDSLRGAADIVILDCPPVLVVPDSLVLVPFADAAVLVVDSETTTMGSVRESKHQLDQVGGKLLGGILNNVPPPSRGHYGYGYGYGPDPEREVQLETT